MQTATSPDGTTIAYDTYGSGPALILVGGAFQYRAFDPASARLAQMLGQRFTTVHYDRRGRGDSTDTPPYDPAREVEDLAAVIEQVGGPARLFGMSSGGVLALEAAAAGLDIARVAVYEPPLIVDDTREPVPADYLATLDALVGEGRRGDAVAYAMATAMGVPEEMVASMRQGPAWAAFEAVAHTLAYDGAFMAPLMQGRPLDLPAWSSAKLPVLVIGGGDSPPWIRHAADAVVQALPKARGHTLDHQTHAVAPEVLAPVLADFLRR
jgi:pimeloyl-ACP methyl ester carboxylesterase